MNEPLVGRGPQLAELTRLREAANAGEGGFVLLWGEPGIGKTALLARVTADAAAAGTPVLTGRAVADEGAPPFWPWLRVLEQGQLPQALLEMGDGPPEAARFLAIERTVRALQKAAEPDGLVVALDDLHWADDASLRLLRHLCAELSGSRVLVMGTAREVIDVRPAHTIRVGPLSEEDIAKYLERTDPSWAAYVHRVTGGNPLFVRELVRVLVQDGRATEKVPAQLRRMAGYRMDRLSAECRWLLGGASAIGEEFDVALLEEAVRSETHDRLTEAVQAGVLVDEPETPQRLRFAHALVREARYDELSRTERIEWHRRIAEALSSRGDAPAGELARHRVRAAVDEAERRTAAEACRAAAEAAKRVLAFGDAAYWYTRALELSKADPALLLDLADAEYSDGRVSEALQHCAAAAERTTDMDLVARAALVVRGIDGEPNVAIAALCERARALLGERDSAAHAQVLAQHALALSHTGDLDIADALSRRAMAMAERTGDPTALVDAMHARQRMASSLEGVTERLELGARMRELGAVPQRPEAALWAHLWRIEAAFQVGATATVDSELLSLATMVERLGWPLGRWHLLRARSTRALMAGRFAEAERLGLAAHEVALRLQDTTTHGLFFAIVLDLLRYTGRFGEYEPELSRMAQSTPVPIVQAIYARYLLAAGEADQASMLFEQFRPALATLPRDVRWSPTIGYASELAAGLGVAETAELCYRLLLPYGAYHVGSTTGYLGAVTRPLGILATALGDLDAADRHLAKAVAMENRVGSPLGVVLARLAHARALAARGGPGDRERAAMLAEQAAHTARQVGMAPALAEATALAGELSGGPATLTRREREIAMLVADGLANRAIADRLVLSERTVETHVRNLLTKLGLANRTQVAAWALRAGLRTPSQ